MAGSRAESANTASFTKRRRTVRAWQFTAGLVPIFLVIPTAFLALWVMFGLHFNGLYGQDPYAYYDYGVGPLRHLIVTGTTPPAFYWPLGFPLLITLTSFMAGTGPMAGQFVSLIAGLSTIPLTYLLTRDLLAQVSADPDTARLSAVVAALLLGATGWLLQSTVAIMADTVALVSTLISAWALVRWSMAADDTRAAAWLALSGTTLMWSVVTRWGQAILIPVWLLALFTMSHPSSGKLLRSVPVALAAAAIVFLPQLWLMLSVRANPVLGSIPFAGNLGQVSGGAWSVLHLFQNDFLTVDGSQHNPVPNLVFYVSAPFRDKYLTPLCLPAALFGTVVTFTRFRRALALLVGWPAALLLFDAGLAQQNPRFVLAALPPITILAGIGIAAVWGRLLSRGRILLGSVFVASLLVVTVVGARDVRAFVALNNSDRAVATWTAARVPNHAVTLSFAITLTLSHETRLHPVDIFSTSQTELARLVAGPRSVYLLVQENSMSGQWALRAPGQNFRYLHDHPGLVRVGALNGYTLFRVRKH